MPAGLPTRNHGQPSCLYTAALLSRGGTSDPQMPILILFFVASIAGSLVFLLGSRYPTPVVGQARRAGRGTEARARSGSPSMVVEDVSAAVLTPPTATGLALTVALAAAMTGGLVLGLLAYLMRTNAQLVEIDNSVGQWEVDHATHLSTQALQRVTDLAGTYVVVLVIIVVAIAEVRAHPQQMGAGIPRLRRRRRDRPRHDDQSSAGPGAAELQPGRSDARPVVPKRPFGDGGRPLCGSGARAGTSSSTAHTCPHRRGRRRRSQWQSRAAA